MKKLKTVSEISEAYNVSRQTVYKRIFDRGVERSGIIRAGRLAVNGYDQKAIEKIMDPRVRGVKREKIS